MIQEYHPPFDLENVFISTLQSTHTLLAYELGAIAILAPIFAALVYRNHKKDLAKVPLGRRQNTPED